MIVESISVVFLALGLDLAFGDPKNKYHPTAWIGMLIAKITPLTKNASVHSEKIGGILIVCIVTAIVVMLLLSLDYVIHEIFTGILLSAVIIVTGTFLLKTTFAIKGMQRHALAVVDALDCDNLDLARNHLSMIVKRDTKNLDKNHIISGVLESISENTVDGITGPLFYFGLFGLPGAFAYRVINTFDSMIGYKTQIFRNIGWFGANCDNAINYIPSRLTAIVMVIGAMLLGADWKNSYHVVRVDGNITQSPNAGYPMAALAGALGTKFEKVGHYEIGHGSLNLDRTHIISAIKLMKVTSILFCTLIVIPMILVISYFGWWLHA